MKCIVLAGGRVDRLWPLSRKNLPKQFIQLRGDHSLFQETIARNMSYCDEFIIVTGEECRHIVKNQLSVFQGLVHRIIYEGEGRNTAAAIALACMDLPLSEKVVVVPGDQMIYGTEYKDDLMSAREMCDAGSIVALGVDILEPDIRFSYIHYENNEALELIEKPDANTADEFAQREDFLIHTGILMFRVGDFMHELRQYSGMIYSGCRNAYPMKKLVGNECTFSAEVMRTIPALSIESAMLKKTKLIKVIHSSFVWRDLGSLEELKQTELRTAPYANQVRYNCENTDIINQCERRAVVANSIDDVIIVNTKDVVYVGKKGHTSELKDILEKSPQIEKFIDGCRIIYRDWGCYELLVDTSRYKAKKVEVNKGKVIQYHKHLYRSEHIIIVEGEALIELDGVEKQCGPRDMIDVPIGTVHQIINTGDETLTFIEASVGENVLEDDKVTSISSNDKENYSGRNVEPFTKLRPIYKDWLWGGNRLKEVYGKKCDYDIVAESWELSAHEAGASIVDSGRYRGMNFAEYLNTIGKNNWGWKCRPLMAFPILIKFIDARDSLSVQVHPDDDYALAVENQYGKNEMWYILDCEPDAYLYCGFNQDVTREEVKRRVEDNTILEVLNKIPVHKGETYFIPAGTVHAIGAGILICEIQQSSNCTYRLYDFDRRDKFGNLRELHIDKALDVINYSKYEPQRFEDDVVEGDTFTKRLIGRCKYFECAKVDIDGSMGLQGVEESFTSIICLSGKGTISLLKEKNVHMNFKAGDSIFIPKSDTLMLIEGQCELILTRI